MTRTGLVAILTPCYSRISLVAAADKPTATCEAGKQPKVTTINRVGTITVVCPNSLQLKPTLEEEAASMKVLTSPKSEANPPSICKVCPGAGCVKCSTNAKAYDLTIKQLPSKPATFFFHCESEKNSQDKDCYIGINVEAHSPLGPNTCAVPGSEINFSVDKAGEAVHFGCGTGSTLRPAAIKRTYDESCSTEIDLPADIALNKKEDNTFELAVQKLPASALKICYVCGTKGKDTKEEKKCSVRIAVRKSDTSGALSLSVASRAAALLQVALTAAAFLLV